MTQIHSHLPPAKFEIPNGVTKQTVCIDSGNLANFNCKHTYTEYFLKDTVPDICKQH